MVTKGLIKKINYLENNCTVRLPLFETAGQTSEVCITAIFAVQPGTINSYKENDVVIVAFENNSINSPVVIGKLYLGASTEGKEYRGAIKCESLAVETDATLPITTKLTFDGDTTNIASVQGSATNYKSILDIVKALQQAEDNINYSSKELLSLDSQISEIKISYLETNQRDNIPTAEDERWQDGMPTWKDEWFIWQKTTYYNRHGQILGTPEIICLSTISTVASYWITCSSRIHTGTKQPSNIKVTAMAKFGNDLNTTDSNAFLKYKWASDKSWSTTEESETPYELVIEPINCKDEDLIIEAWRSTDTTAYDSETITFVPKDTPVLDLDNDSAAIAYDSRGTQKLNPSDTVSSTAAVYFNGQKVNETIEFTWTLTNCKIQGSDETTVKSNSITIYDIADIADVATAECSATYRGAVLKKVFTITKAKQGNSPYKIDIINDFVSVNTGSDGIINNYDWSNTEHTINIYYGDKLETRPIKIISSTNGLSATSGLSLLYILDSVETDSFPNDTTIDDGYYVASIKSLNNLVGSIHYCLYEGTTAMAAAKFEMNKVCNGADGADAVMYKATATSEVVKWNTNGECETESITFSLNKITGSSSEPATFWLIMQTNNTKPWTQGDKGYTTTYTMSSLTGVTQKCTLLFYTDKTSRNKAFEKLDNTLNWQSLESGLKPVDTIEVIAVKDGKDGKDGDPIIVQYAYWWSDDYLDSPLKESSKQKPDADLELPTDTSWDWTTSAKKTWKTSNFTPAADETHKIIFVSRRSGTATAIKSAPWSNPEIFATHDEKAYQILKTSEGLFGYGQGVYYTPTETITLADGITKKNAGEPITQEQATKFVALDPDTNKEKVKLYIDANYIRTGAFTVKDGNNILFQAGLDTGVNKTPVVKIAGFDVGTNGIYNTDFITSFKEATSTNKVNKPGVYIGTDGIRLGDSFSVDPNGNVKASSLTISASNVDGLGSLATKDSLSASDVGATTMSEVESMGYQNSDGVVSIIEGTVTADFINAKNITANQIEVNDDAGKTIFKASATDKSTTIGYFEVNEKGLYMTNKSGTGADKGENNSDTSNLYIDNNHILMQGNAKNTNNPSSSSFGNFYYGMSPDNGPGGYGLFGSFITRIHTTATSWSSSKSDNTLITEVPGIIEANFSRKSSLAFRPTTIIIAQIPIAKGTNYWNITKTMSGALQIEQDGKKVDNPDLISFAQCIPEKLLANILNIQATVCMNATPPTTTGGWTEVTHPITLYAHKDIDSKSTVVIHSNADCSAYVSVYCSVYPTGYTN